MSQPDEQDPKPTGHSQDNSPDDANHDASAVAGPADEEEEEQAPTPFDHPLFLPVLLSGLTLWFGYDAFLNQDPDMLEHLTFNRVGFGILFVASLYYGIQGYKEWKEDQDE